MEPRNLPPGPINWPVLGNVFDVLVSSYNKEQVHELMTRLAKTYGKIFSFGLGNGNRVILLSDIDLIKEAFQKPELSDRIPDFPIFAKLRQHGKGKKVFMKQ